MTVEILLPVTHHALQVTSAPTGSETRLEMLVLRYIHHMGTSDVAHVARAFGLRHRLALGVALSLWREGSLLVDLHRGDIRVTPEVAGLCESGDLEVLNERRRRVDEQEVILEPVSGFVGLFKDTVRPSRGSAPLIAPAPANPIDITDVLRKDLLGVVLRAKRSSDSYERADRRIVEVGLGSPTAANAPSGASRFLQIEISASQGVDEEDVHVRVLTDGSRMTALQRQRIETFLLDLLHDRPQERLVSTIRSAARGPLLAPPTVGERIELMRRRSSRSVEGITPDRSQSEHDTLVDQAIAIERDLSDRGRSAACSIELLTSAAQLRATSSVLIRRARDQVVIVSPWIRREALNTIYDDLRDALDRNVDVVILWGIGDGDVLDADVLNMLSSLSGPGRPTPGRLLVGRQSARTHAKLVVQDDAALLLSSHNLLSSDDGRTEFGLLLSDTEGHSPQVLGDALRWVQNAYPSYQQARTFLLQHDPPQATPVVDLPAPPPLVENPVAVDAWQRAWQAYIDDAERRHDDVGLHVRGLVENQRHRQMLTEALQSANRRVLATGQRLTAQSINQAMLGEFRRYLDRVENGVLVLVHDAGEGVDAEVSAALVALALDHPGRFACQAVDGWHAKLLVWDDEAVVSSFNFLSFEGSYRNRESRTRSELGVQISGGLFADQLFAAALSAANASDLVEAPPPARGIDHGRSIQPVSASAWEHIRELLDLDRSVVAEAFLERVDSGERREVIDALSASGGHEDLAAQLAAAALSAGDALPSWQHRLGMKAWERGDFLLAHAILPEDLTEPSLPLRVIAAALDSPSIGPAIAAFDPDDFRPRERPALLLAGIWAVLNGHAEALSLLTRHDEDFQELRRAATEYFDRSRGRAAPWDELHAHDREARRAERIESSRSTILESLDQLERSNSLGFKEGRLLQRYWRRDDSSFNELRRSLAVHGSTSAWLHEWGEEAAAFLASNCRAGATGEIDIGRQPGLHVRLDRLLDQVRDYEHLQDAGRDLNGLNTITEHLRSELQDAARRTGAPASTPDVADVVVARCRHLLFGGEE